MRTCKRPGVEDLGTIAGLLRQYGYIATLKLSALGYWYTGFGLRSMGGIIVVQVIRMSGDGKANFI